MIVDRESRDIRRMSRYNEFTLPPAITHLVHSPLYRYRKQIMNQTNTVIFDLDDTLHDDTSAYVQCAYQVACYVADRYGIDSHELASAYLEEANDFWERLNTDELPRLRTSQEENDGRAIIRARFWGLAFARFGISNRELAGWCSYAYDEFRGRQLALFPGVGEMLATLRERGVKLGLLTNGLAQTHRSRIEQLGLTSAFDGIFLADEVGFVKPDPKFFLHACEKLGAQARYTAMVGDRYERDIIGAQAAGMFTVWVDTGRDALPENSTPPHATVRNVIEIPRVLHLAA